MADSRRTRDYQPDAPIDEDYLRTHNPVSGTMDLSYTPLDRIGGPGMGGAGNESSYTSSVDHDQLMQNIQDLGAQRSALEDQLASLRSQPQSGGMSLGDFFSGLKNAASSGLSSLGNGLSAMAPNQGTIDNIAMRLQRAHAIGQGTLPYYMQEQMANHQLAQSQDLMAMKRDQLANSLQTLALQKQQKDEDQALGVWKDPNMPLSMKKKISDQLRAQGNVLAGNLGRLADEHLIGQLDTLKQYLPAGKLGELINIMRQPNADLSPVEQWRDYALERKKAYGEAQMKSERFTGLLQAYNNGQLDQNSPEYDEFKQLVGEREKKQKESSEMDLKLQQLGLGNKKAALDLAAKSVMPVVGDTINQPGGGTKQAIFDPQTGNLSYATGDKAPLVQMNPGEKAFDVEQGKLKAKQIEKSGEQANEASQIIRTIHNGRDLLNKKIWVGSNADIRLALGKALQFAGYKGNDEPMANTEAFLSNMASNVGRVIKMFGAGTGLSNADREYAEALAGGRISMTKQGLQKVLDDNEKASRFLIEHHNNLVKKLGGDKSFNVDMPGPYKPSVTSSQVNELSPNEANLARQLKQRGMSRDQIEQAILQQRGGK